MFDAQKLLGGMLKQGIGKSLPGGGVVPKGLRRLGGGLLDKEGGLSNKAVMGMGVLGVAMAAVDHYMGDRDKQAPQQAPPQQAPSYQASPHASATYSPPATPPTTPGAPPPPPPGSVAQGSVRQDSSSDDSAVAIACIRAMIAAAWADGALDGLERANILRGLSALDLSPEETSFLQQELATPHTIPAIITNVATPDAARAVYTAASMAIVTDTAAEQAFLDDLAAQLGIDPSTASALQQGALGIPTSLPE